METSTVKTDRRIWRIRTCVAFRFAAKTPGDDFALLGLPLLAMARFFGVLGVGLRGGLFELGSCLGSREREFAVTAVGGAVGGRRGVGGD